MCPPRARPHHRVMALRVLIVDDDPGFRRIAREVLEAGEIDVVGEAGTGADAVAVARSLRPDGVLLDVQLPDTDGFTVARALSGLGIPVVLCSVRDYPDGAAVLPKERLSADELRRFLGEKSR
jgi:CheY-like chemotaxis protein